MSEEYDNTNRGAAFQPFPAQRLILQGKFDADGNNYRCVLVADETKAGKKLVRVYAEAGVLFVNDKKGNDKAPDYSGAINRMSLPEKKIAGWKKQSEAGNKFLSVSLSDPQYKEKASEPDFDIDDEVPF